MQPYQEMFAFVKDKLEEYDSHGGKEKAGIQYSRYDHTRRVYQWMLILSEDLTLDIDSLTIATIFHDVGYASIDGREEHAITGAKVCQEYLAERNYPKEQITFIVDMIRNHSNKERIFENIPMEQVILMEADLLDDTGAQGAVMDVWIEAQKPDVSFESIRNHIERYTYRMMQDNPMRTELAQRIWEEKRNVVNAFYDSYCKDLRMPEGI